MERYQVWPMAKVNGEWSIPDEIFQGLWKKMSEEGKSLRLFYSANITTEGEWLEWTKAPGNLFLLVVDSLQKKIVCVAWLNNVMDGAAQVHFCMLGLPRPEIGKMALAFWSKAFPLSVIVGLTPESYRDAIKYAEKIGFKRKGSISQICNMVYEGRREAGVITEYLVNKEE